LERSVTEKDGLFRRGARLGERGRVQKKGKKGSGWYKVGGQGGRGGNQKGEKRQWKKPDMWDNKKRKKQSLFRERKVDGKSGNRKRIKQN